MGSRTVRPVVLAVAGSDSSGGAGIAADIRAAQSLGTTLRIALTAVTAQSDHRVASVHPVPADVIRNQLRLALADSAVGAIKIGMLGSAAAAETVAEVIMRHGELPVVIDPVVASSSGRRLLDDAAMNAFLGRLLPRATLLTPNLPELAILARAVAPAGSFDEIGENARLLLAAGAKAVLVKGGHAEGEQATDLLFEAGGEQPHSFSSRRSAVRLRGTGCTLSTVVAISLARGQGLVGACRAGKDHMTALFQRAARNAT